MTTTRQQYIVETFYAITDSLLVALQKRKDAYMMLDSRFGVLTQFKRMTDAEIRDGLKTLISIYLNDVEPSSIDEFIQFRYFVEREESDQSVLQMHKLLKHRNLESSFPNIDILFWLASHYKTMCCLTSKSKNYLRYDEDGQRTRIKDSENKAIPICRHSTSSESLNYLKLTLSVKGRTARPAATKRHL